METGEETGNQVIGNSVFSKLVKSFFIPFYRTRSVLLSIFLYTIHLFHSLLDLPPWTPIFWFVVDWMVMKVMDANPGSWLCQFKRDVSQGIVQLGTLTTPPLWCPSSTSPSFLRTSLPDGIVVYQQEGTSSCDCLYARPLATEPNGVYPSAAVKPNPRWRITSSYDGAHSPGSKGKSLISF